MSCVAREKTIKTFLLLRKIGKERGDGNVIYTVVKTFSFDEVNNMIPVNSL